MALRRIIIAVAGAAAFFVSAADAQITAPVYSSPNGNTLVAQGVIPVGTDGTSAALPIRVTTATTSGTVTTANAFQSILAANPVRRGCAVYNTSGAAETIYLGAPGAATAAQSIPLPAGGSFNCGSFQGLVLTDQISLTSGTAGSAFVVVSQ